MVYLNTRKSSLLPFYSSFRFKRQTSYILFLYVVCGSKGIVEKKKQQCVYVVQQYILLSKDSTCTNDYGGRKYYTKHTNGHMLHYFSFFFSLVFGFFPYTLSLSLSPCPSLNNLANRMTNDHSVCHKIWLSGRSPGNGTCLEERPGRHRKLQLDNIVSMFQDLVQLKITTLVTSKRSN